MTASLWFHGSAWPPGNHCTIPFGSWSEAMWSTVRARPSDVTRSSTSGSHTGGLLICWGGRRGGGPGRIDHDALPDPRVQQALGEASDERRLGDVPHQHLVVR